MKLKGMLLKDITPGFSGKFGQGENGTGGMAHKRLSRKKGV